MGQIVNKQQLAAVLGKSERALTEWQKEAGFPIKSKSARGGSNQYDTEAVIEWMIQRAVGGAEKESSGDRLNRIRADREELNLAKDIGELIPANETKEALYQVTTAIRTNFLSGNSKLKHELDTLYDINLDISILHDHSRNLLTHLSEIAGESEDGDTDWFERICTATPNVIDGLGEQVPLVGG
jgi:phage terminase Nu1 subunit (DNA packaging protein)